MALKSPSPRVIVICEVATAIWSLYLLARAKSFVWVLDRALVAVAALLIARAVWKREAWAHAGVVALAAYVGIPTLIRVVSMVWVVSLTGDAWPNIGDLVQQVAQLVALIGGLHELAFRRPAA